jgi:hypothetical protein
VGRRVAQGSAPNEGEVIAQKADGNPVVSCNFSPPLDTMLGDVEIDQQICWCVVNKRMEETL